MDFFSNYQEYHFKLIDTLKTVLYQKDNSVFEKLDFHDDNIFIEPLLFACINNNYEEWIDTLTFSLSKNKANHKPVRTQTIKGSLVYLPNIGYLKLESNYENILIRHLNNEIIISDEVNNNINYEHLPLITNDEGIEFLKCNHPLLEPLFIDEKGNNTSVLIREKLYNKHIQNFNNALNVIKKIYPEYYTLINSYIKKVIFYEGEANSFATIQAHGMVFFNIREDYNEIFFLDNIIHQCAHVFFNALTFDKKELFTLPHNSDLSLFTEEESDKGFGLYDRFHGLFTQTNINICIQKCLKQKIYDGDKNFELIGRFTSNMKRFSIALNKFNQKEKYKSKGLKWYLFFESIYYNIYTENKEVIEQWDVSNQPYVFDYKIFKNTNRV